MGIFWQNNPSLTPVGSLQEERGFSTNTQEEENSKMGISLRPSTFVEGGAVPVDKFLKWVNPRFELFDYQGKAPETTAFGVDYTDDDGQVSAQYYSVASPDRFTPSEDGKTLVAVKGDAALSKSSNYYILMNALINAGFPENRLNEDISILDGLETYNIGLPEPKRSGMAPRAVEPGQVVREKVLSVPSQIRKLPWDKKATKTTVAGKAPAKKTEDDGDTARVTDKLTAFIGGLVDDAGDEGVTRSAVGVAVMKQRNDPDKDAMARILYGKEVGIALAAAGYTLDGENITKAG